MSVELVPLTTVSSFVNCKGCGEAIKEQYLLKVGQNQWHESCVKCESCSTHLFDRCYERDGKLFCKLHYYRLYSRYKCSGCQEGISPTDMVYRLRNGILYHIPCHRCFRCNKALCPGEQIVVEDASKAVACIDHYQDMFNAEKSRRERKENPEIQQTPVPPTFPVSELGSHPSQQLNYVPLDGGSSFSYFMGSEDSLHGLAAQKYLKRRGPRTTIKQNQLDVLNRIFTATPKPSKHARAKIALETGLTMRVIQVWFQNRRSKERRLKHLCNWIRENENRGLIPPISPIGSPGCQSSLADQSSMGMGVDLGEDDDQSLCHPDQYG